MYHLSLTPDQIAHTIILVGDPDRVPLVSQHFDRIDHKVQHREFTTHTGWHKGKPLTVLSTGIGTANIDIVLNELDALVNVDPQTQKPREKLTSLTLVRIGTSGSIQKTLALDSITVSGMAVGLDSLMHFYAAENTVRELTIGDSLLEYFEQRSELLLMPYVFEADKELLKSAIAHPVFRQGVTVTAPGFYAPQGRIVRGRVEEPALLKFLTDYKSKDLKLTNIEMETAALYGMSRLLGHRAISFSAILANRLDNTFSENPEDAIQKTIEQVLGWVSDL